MADASGERERLLRAVAEQLHDLCQPLTALQCRLEIGQITERTEQETVSTVWAECLRECERLNKAVATLRDLVQQARASEQRSEG